MPDRTATKQDLANLEARIGKKLDSVKQDVAQLEASVKQDMVGLEARIDEKLQDVETRILRAIYGYTETVTTRLEGAVRRLSEFDARLVVVEGRVLEIEKRLSLPPSA